MGVVKIIIRVLSYICYAVIGVYAIICVPMIFACRPVVVLTGSMSPTYERGTIIYYKHVDKSEIAVDDVVTYQLNDQMVTHRVKRIENGAFITQGDANNVEDGRPVEYDSIVGKVGGMAIPILGFGIQFINDNPWVFAIVVAILLAEFLMSNVKRGKISVSEKGRGHEKDDEDLAH